MSSRQTFAKNKIVYDHNIFLWLERQEWMICDCSWRKTVEEITKIIKKWEPPVSIPPEKIIDINEYSNVDSNTIQIGDIVAGRKVTRLTGNSIHVEGGGYWFRETIISERHKHRKKIDMGHLISSIGHDEYKFRFKEECEVIQEVCYYE